MLAVFIGFTIALTISNIVFLVLFLRQKPSQKRLDLTAQQLINDLTATGNALVRLERIAPSDVFLRSPKQ
jgi:glucokinase